MVEAGVEELCDRRALLALHSDSLTGPWQTAMMCRFARPGLIVTSIGLAACSSQVPVAATTGPVAATTGPVAAASDTALAPPDAAPGVRISTMTTGVRKWAADGSVEEGDILPPAPYDVAVSAALPAIGHCKLGEAETSLFAILEPSGVVRRIEPLGDANACVNDEIRTVRFPAHATDATCMIVIVRP